MPTPGGHPSGKHPPGFSAPNARGPRENLTGVRDSPGKRKGENPPSRPAERRAAGEDAPFPGIFRITGAGDSHDVAEPPAGEGRCDGTVTRHAGRAVRGG
ncbi:hypothetical protein GCM10027160_14760 [Streptomyces calidiresistens]